MRHPIRRISAALAVAAVASLTFAATPGFAADAPKPSIVLKMQSSKLGEIMTDSSGNSLYLFTPDSRNVSVCEGQCLTAWPPVMLSPKDTLANVELQSGLRRSKLGVAMRADGSRQLTYNGWPLYYWFQDKAAGDVKGQWVNNIWFVLNAEGNAITTRL